MKATAITKDNCLDFVDRRFSWHGNPIKIVEGQVKKLCRIAPEFTHHPTFIIEPVNGESNYFKPAKIFLSYKSDYYYDGKCKFRFLASWFGFDENKLVGLSELDIDYQSFGIKQASQARIDKILGIANQNNY